MIGKCGIGEGTHYACECTLRRIDDLETKNEAMAELLRSVQYRAPTATHVPECIGCGVRGPVDERLRKLPAEPCLPKCPFNIIEKKS